MTSGDDESGIEGPSAPHNTQAEILMDAMAMPANANLEVNVRQEALKAYLHQRFRHLCNPSAPITWQLFVDDLPKAI